MIRNTSLDAAVGKTMSSKKFSNKTNEIFNTLYRKFANSYLTRYDDKLNEKQKYSMKSKIRKRKAIYNIDYQTPPAPIIPAVDLIYRNFKQSSSVDVAREYNPTENIQQDKESNNIISPIKISKSTTGGTEFKHIITSTKRNNQKTSSMTQSTNANYLLFKNNYFDISNNTIDYENSQYTQKRYRNIKTIIHPLMIFKSTTKREELKYRVADDQKMITREYVTSGLNPNPPKINITNLIYKKHKGSHILNVIKGGKYKDNIRETSMQNQNIRHPIIMSKSTSRQKLLSTKIPKVSLIYRAFAPINSSERFNTIKTYEENKTNQHKHYKEENVPLPFSTIKYISRKSDLKHITINHQKSSTKWSAHLNYTSKPKANLLYRAFVPSNPPNNVRSTKAYKVNETSHKKYYNTKNVTIPFTTFKSAVEKTEMKPSTRNYHKSYTQTNAEKQSSSKIISTLKPEVNLIYRAFEASNSSINVKATKANKTSHKEIYRAKFATIPSTTFKSATEKTKMKPPTTNFFREKEFSAISTLEKKDNALHPSLNLSNLYNKTKLHYNITKGHNLNNKTNQKMIKERIFYLQQLLNIFLKRKNI
ncbi:hypothetical protein CEXT_90551 [Caerostris extrusa]|uniref:Uncharacterized protein n=1 Tax=Caerostris extrusa TaxID=172846 RepID=A0AAV4MI14_CAEEX|nr:hypothetical protein CEXT_90551 [Caerostris extrusa]